MTFDYDVIIIGSGPGGYATALRTAEMGLNTAVIEMRDEIGGTCLNRGCIPTKAYLTAAHTLHDAARANTWGIDICVNSIDMPAFKAAKDKTVAGVVKGLSQHMKARKIDIIHGFGSLIEPHLVRVEDGRVGGEHEKDSPAQDESDTKEFTAQHIVIATGSYSAPLPGFEGFHGTSDEVRQSIQNGDIPILTSDEALDLDTKPENVVIVGAGAIALEFANFWNALGTHVTILLRKDVPLSRWDSRISAMMMRTLKRNGITFETHSHLAAAADGHVTYEVTNPKTGEKSTKTIPADFILSAIGRKPNTTADWFASSGVKLDSSGFVITDDYGRTNLEDVWALGDVTGGFMLAHQAFEQALTVSESIAGVPTRPVDMIMVPRVVFGIIEALSVGYTLEQAQEAGLSDVEETTVPMLSNPRVAMIGSNGTTLAITAVDSETNERIVVGIHMAGPNVSELSAAARQIVQNRIPLHSAAHALFAHPTLSESLGETLLKADGRPLNVR